MYKYWCDFRNHLSPLNTSNNSLGFADYGLHMISILLNFCKLKRSVIQYSAQCINLFIFFPGMYFDFWCQKLTKWDFIKERKFIEDYLSEKRTRKIWSHIISEIERDIQILKRTKCALCDKSPIFYFMGRGVKSKQRTVANSNLIQLSHFWRVACWILFDVHWFFKVCF